MANQGPFQGGQHSKALLTSGRPLARYAMRPFPSAPHRTDRTAFTVASSPVMFLPVGSR